MNIGYKLYKKDKTDENYADMAVWCNKNQAYIEDKGEYYEIKENPIEPVEEPTTQEILWKKEREYAMARWQHEYIVANSSSFPEYVVKRAKELEDLAEELRRA